MHLYTNACLYYSISGNIFIKNHQWIGYLGLIVILIVALQLIIGGMSDLNIIQINENFKRFF